MRIVVAILTASLVLGLTWLYQQTLAENQMPAAETEAREVHGTYRLRIVATFDAGVDPFAEDVSKASSLSVSLLGRPVLSIDEPIPAGQPIDTTLDLDLRSGTNEFLIDMTPANSSDITPKAIHIELYQGSGLQPIESQTIWAAGTDTKLVGRVSFDVDSDASLPKEQP
ncbi:hypothetical protein C5Y96_23220 [Blastopirellula marina]|uniref:Uncharacterized protein n=1 Tax=Blastopirellula marina TaxID=124 RepID=A0A2S8F0N0_9BACT|nr:MULTISPECIES: hypothetical protein [Pirellulaceae]PQO25725.1 hypothetical protein C5Y96_23220 [Blastopirellula marina]RCS43408.1 hypothetical protein DTL36_23270 [Bremerella cremea]